MAPTVQLSRWCSATCFGTVSVVMMACAAPVAAGQAAGHLVHDLGDPGEHLVHRKPITDQPGRADGHLDGARFGAPIRQRCGERLRGGVGVLEPAGPVQALAPPELRITARNRPVVSTCWVHNTGAALTLLRVNTPAAA